MHCSSMPFIVEEIGLHTPPLTHVTFTQLIGANKLISSDQHRIKGELLPIDISQKVPPKPAEQIHVLVAILYVPDAYQ